MVFETKRLGVSFKTFRRFKKASKSLRKKEQKFLPIQIKGVPLRPIETVEVEKQSQVRFTLR